MPGITVASLPRAVASGVRSARSRLRWPERVVAISALLLLVFMFGVSWYTFTALPGGTRATTPPPAGGGVAAHPFLVRVPISKNGWNGANHLHWLLLVTIIAALALFVTQAARRSPAIPVTLSLFVLLL